MKPLIHLVLFYLISLGQAEEDSPLHEKNTPDSNKDLENLKDPEIMDKHQAVDEKKGSDDIISFKEFVSKFNKKYEKHEEKKRYHIFQENVQAMADHNKLYESGKSSFKMGVNKYSDMTYDEVVSTLTGDLETKDERAADWYVPTDLGLEPDALDYRQQGAVNPIRDQGDCNSCWAFCAVSCIESHIYLTNGNQVQLSEQYLVDCSKGYGFPADPPERTGCENGWKHTAMEYVENNGIALRDMYPYIEDAGTCNENAPKTSERVTGIQRVQLYKDNELLNALVQAGPITVSIWVSANFQHYDSGILFDDNCTNVGKTTNHAVVLVGYGTENRQDYWILRNSWGETWGEQGYIKLARNVENHCQISSKAYFPTIEVSECGNTDCKAMYNNQSYPGICRSDGCLSTETKADGCPNSNCTCCIDVTSSCRISTCEYKGVSGRCSSTDINGWESVGEQQCKGCKCYIPPQTPNITYVGEECCKLSTTPACVKKGGSCLPINETCYGDEFTGSKYCVISNLKSCKCCVPIDCEKKTLDPCKKLNGTCIGAHEECDGSSVQGKEFCKNDKTCKCCFPSTTAPCPCGQDYNGGCTGWEGSQVYSGHCMKTCELGSFPLTSHKCDQFGAADCNCCASKECPGSCDAVYKNETYKGVCRFEDCLSDEIKADKCPNSNCNCCINVTSPPAPCNPSRCYDRGGNQRDGDMGYCSRENMQGYLNIGEQQCTDGCECWMPDRDSCDPPTCEYKGVSGRCTSTTIDGWVSVGPQQCRSCKCYVPPQKT